MPENYKHCYIIFESGTNGYLIKEEIIPFDNNSVENQYYKIADLVDELMQKGLKELEIASTINYIKIYPIKTFKEEISPYNDFNLLDMQLSKCESNTIYYIQTLKKITKFTGLIRYDASKHNISLKNIKDYEGNITSVELYLN